jgi:inner membrane protein
MPWWGWLITGTVLFGAEMFGISAEFYLVFLGAAAIAVGLLELVGIHLPEWGQWLCFAALSVACMVTFRKRLYHRLRATPGDVEARLPPGSSVRLAESLAAGASGRVEFRGTSWTARNVGSQTIEAGTEAEICEIAGLTLHVRAKPAA